jgi:hypothetical protein
VIKIVTPLDEPAAYSDMQLVIAFAVADRLGTRKIILLERAEKA